VSSESHKPPEVEANQNVALREHCSRHVNEHLVRELKFLLSEAEAGNLRSFISVSGWVGGFAGNGFSFGDYSTPEEQLIGEFEYLKARIIAKYLKNNGFNS
jgi:hypothetical protein